MKTFPTLYKRTKTGAIQYWKICVDLLTYPTIYKESGQLHTTSPIQHREGIRKGKNIGKSNETSPAEQAALQAESDWKKKRDEGYKSLDDLGISEVEGRDAFTSNSGFHFSLEEVLQENLLQFNTDASGNAKPMLAKAVDWKKVKYPCYIQPKLDGVRCLMVVSRDSEGIDVTFLSRSGKEYTTLNHIAEDLRKAGQFCWNSPFILDGEIYSEELSFQDIVAAVKKQRPESLKLKFRAYDVVSDENQEDRWARTVEIVDTIKSPHIWPVVTLTVSSKDDVKLWHDKWVEEGYEGAMIRHLNGMYGQGQRSSDLLKVKEFDDNEFEAVGWTYGQRPEDLMAVCVSHKASAARVAASEDTFSVKMMGTEEYKKELEKIDINGKKITVKHFGWTDDGMPRFPIGKAVRDE